MTGNIAVRPGSWQHSFPPTAPSPKCILHSGCCVVNNLDTMLIHLPTAGHCHSNVHVTLTREGLFVAPSSLFRSMKITFEDTPKVQPELFLFLLASGSFRERQDSNGLLPLTQEKHRGLFGQHAWQQEEKEEMDKKREKKKVTGIRRMGGDCGGLPWLWRQHCVLRADFPCLSPHPAWF